MNESGIGKLKKLRDEEPARLISRIRLLWPDIKAALGRHTLKRIHLLLVENGIAIKYQVLSRYVCRLRREDATKLGNSALRTERHRPSSAVAAEQVETPPADLTSSDPLANIRERLIRNRPAFNYEGGDPDYEGRDPDLSKTPKQRSSRPLMRRRPASMGKEETQGTVTGRKVGLL